MAKTYRPYVPEQALLLPPSLREWLPEDHLAYFVSDLIDQLDLSAITTVYENEERGYPPYHPLMLTKVLVYAYCVGVFSSRKIQRRLVEDVAFRVLAVGNEPDFRTIADRTTFGIGHLVEAFNRLGLGPGRHDRAVTIGPATVEEGHRRRASAAPPGYYNFYYTGHPPTRDAARN